MAAIREREFKKKGADSPNYFIYIKGRGEKKRGRVSTIFKKEKKEKRKKEKKKKEKKKKKKEKKKSKRKEKTHRERKRRKPEGHETW